jgi:hypothetical protein
VFCSRRRRAGDWVSGPSGRRRRRRAPLVASQATKAEREASPRRRRLIGDQTPAKGDELFANYRCASGKLSSLERAACACRAQPAAPASSPHHKASRQSQTMHQPQDLDCDGRPYQRMPRHAPPPPVTPVDPYAATEPVLTDTLEQAEVPIPPAAGAAVLSEIIEGAATAPWKDAAAEALHRAAALEARRDALLRGLESRPRDPHTDRIRRRLALLRAAVARDADIFLRKKLSIVPENDHELAKIGSRERHAQHDLRLVRMALSRLGVDLDASSSSSSDEDEPIVTKKRTQSPEGFPKRFLADAYLAADRAAKKLKAVWKSTSVSGARRWLGRVVRNRRRHAIEQAYERAVNLISTQAQGLGRRVLRGRGRDPGVAGPVRRVRAERGAHGLCARHALRLLEGEGPAEKAVVGAARARPARCCGIASIKFGVGRGGERAAARALGPSLS